MVNVLASLIAAPRTILANTTYRNCMVMIDDPRPADPRERLQELPQFSFSIEAGAQIEHGGWVRFSDVERLLAEAPRVEPPREPCRICNGSSFVAEKRFLDNGYGEVDSCPRCCVGQPSHAERVLRDVNAKLEAALRMTRTKDEHCWKCRVEGCARCLDLNDQVINMRCDALDDVSLAAIPWVNR